MTSHSTKLLHVDWQACNTAKPALSATTGLSIQQVEQCLNHWRMSGMLFQYIGPPDPDINGEGFDVEAEMDCYFYVISNKAPSTFARLLSAVIVPWAWGLAGKPDIQIKWTPDISVPATIYTLYESSHGGGVTESTYGDIPPGVKYVLYDQDNFYIDPSTTENDFVCSRLYLRSIMVAGLGIAYAPRPEADLTQSEITCTAGDVGFNKIIKGYDIDDADADDAGSLGGLVNLISEPCESSYRYNVDAFQRRCLFQWGHPAGYWTDTTRTNIFNDFTFNVRPRNILNLTTGVATLPGLVISDIAEGAKIRFTSEVTSYYWEYTAPGAIVGTPTLIQWDDGTGYDDGDNPTGDSYLWIDEGNGSTVDISDKVTISYTVNDPGDEVLINTVALFEYQNGLAFNTIIGLSGG